MPRYIPSTEDQQREMLHDIGFSSKDELFSDIPDAIRLKRRLDLPEAMSEMELFPLLREQAAKNADIENYTCFLGAGSYDHHIPSVIDHLISRQEFCTAYTPYQPEISQGTLQAIFEYQSMICLLTGMDVSNASLYDGASAIAEAASMARRATGRAEILAAKSIHPESMEVLKTYSRFAGRRVSEFGCRDGAVDLEDLESRMSDHTAAVIVQNPNFFGIVENLSELSELVHRRKAMLIVSCDPISLAILKSPGEAGADIAVGEGQSLGNPLSFGGPYLGFLATRNELMRRMPGRIIGETVDRNGKRAFVLTIQTREQHIRREKATSNICSNQSLNALAATIYLATVGKSGLVRVATLCAQKAHYAFQKLIETGCFSPMFNAPFFKEFALQYNGDTEEMNSRLLGHRIIGGFSLEKLYPELRSGWLMAVTEKRTREEIDNLAERVVSL